MTEVISTFEKAKIGIPGRRPEEILEFKPIPGVYIVPGFHFVEIYELTKNESVYRIILISELGASEPIRGYSITSKLFDRTLYYDTVSIQIYVYFNQSEFVCLDDTSDGKKLIFESGITEKNGVSPKTFPLENVCKKSPDDPYKWC